jgi:hypothetical protein
MKRLLVVTALAVLSLAAVASAQPQSQKPPINIGPLHFVASQNGLAVTGKLTSNLNTCVSKAHVKVLWNYTEVASGTANVNGTWGPLLLVSLGGTGDKETVPVTKSGTFKVIVTPPAGEEGSLCRHKNSRVFELG